MDEKLARIIKLTTTEAARFLGEALPDIGGSGWRDARVFEQLTQRQKLRVSGMDSPTLASLDLPALLCVFERNWHGISFHRNLNSEERTLIHGVLNVRNRIAHQESFPDDGTA